MGAAVLHSMARGRGFIFNVYSRRREAARTPLLSCTFLVCVSLASSTEPQPDRCAGNLTITCENISREKQNATPTSRLGNYSRWAVSTDAAPCANVSRGIYNQGGKTVDAAIATLLCMGVVLPHSMGIGGGFIATIYSKNESKAEVLVAREVAPGNATRDMFNRSAMLSMLGGLAIAVPGELRGYKEMHEKLGGVLCWKNLFEDAVRLAKCGFPMGEHLANALKFGVQKLEKLNKTLPETLNQIFNSTGKLLVKGDTVIQKDLGKTLEEVANSGGADYFYKGRFAEALAAEIQRNKGIITEKDLAAYNVTWEAALNVSFKNTLTMLSVPPPGSGAVLAHILGIMDQYRNSSHECLDDNVQTWHRFVESCKFSYAKRALLGDPAFVNCSDAVKFLTSEDKAAEAKAKINDSHTFPDPTYYGYVNESQEINQGTAHASFWGKDGVVIAVSSSINGYFGSGVRTSSGVILNNQMDDFSTPGRRNHYGVPPSKANYIKPGKRPMSSMAPTVFLDEKGEPVLALGGTGGSKITTGVALVTIRAIWMGQTIKQAIDSPRLHHQLIPDELVVEKNFSSDQIDELERMGHKVTNETARLSVIMGVRKADGRLYANSDYRKGGDVDGE
ncbi:scoloptoxin SSD14-like [Haemaphysalis longicornis]